MKDEAASEYKYLVFVSPSSLYTLSPENKNLDALSMAPNIQIFLKSMACIYEIRVYMQHLSDSRLKKSTMNVFLLMIW